MKNKIIAILACWTVTYSNKEKYIANSHYVYLSYLTQRFKKIYLITPVRESSEKVNLTKLDFPNIEIIRIPYFSNYLSSIKLYRNYYSAIKSVVNIVDFFYCRVPDPFSWMPSLCFKTNCVMHFVGDTIDATKNNEKWSKLKKIIMILGYYPDYILTLKASRKSKVFTNGFHLVEKLKKYGVKANAVISSTVSEKEILKVLPFKDVVNQKCPVNLIYIGYIRFAKGIKTLMRTMLLLKTKNIPFHFDVVGDGEMYEDLKNFIENHNLNKNVFLHGLINDRDAMNKLLQNSDLFIFPSLSEGSPRVVIEAMAQGVPVLSTPVGSVPFTFKDGESIHLFDFNDSSKIVQLVESYIQNPVPFLESRKKAFDLVKEKYTREKFMNTIFSYDA